MRAREWTVAATYGDPTDYDVPALPTWRVERGACGDLAFAATDRDEPFIAAANPVRVRR
ncbi:MULTISPECIES: hypothetical protein [unclassified Halorubrum]|uniref:hypothetical protein n=1 Tax=unclassified Halorubrum TaxID=2642239 RepID=UPI0014829DA1|nr:MULTISPECIES: hypothetical protein [unclassified Halorubrum]